VALAAGFRDDGITRTTVPERHLSVAVRGLSMVWTKGLFSLLATVVSVSVASTLSMVWPGPCGWDVDEGVVGGDG
jgi:hypothetical protein